MVRKPRADRSPQSLRNTGVRLLADRETGDLLNSIVLQLGGLKSEHLRKAIEFYAKNLGIKGDGNHDV